MHSKLAKALVRGEFLQTTIRWIDKKLSVIGIRSLAGSTQVSPKKIVFLTFRGEYDCNPKWICEEIIRRKLPYRLIWVIKDNANPDLTSFPPELTLVPHGNYSFYRHLSSARIIIDNGVSTMYARYPKKKTQTLIETWHGSLGIKKFSHDTVKDKKWIKAAYKEGRKTDWIISNSTFEDDIYRSDYWTKTPIWRVGHARNDILFDKDTPRLRAIRQKIFSLYGIPEGAKICLYAPTFRDDKDMSVYKLDYTAVTDALTTRFGGEWVILTRLHFKLVRKQYLLNIPADVINVSEYPDIQEILACTDCGITDYSSWICEYLHTHRPGFMFAVDLKEYQDNNRDLFFPLTDLPFPVAEENTTLVENILHFDEALFAEKHAQFMNKMGCVDDGHAAERIVDRIEMIIRGETPPAEDYGK